MVDHDEYPFYRKLIIRSRLLRCFTMLTKAPQSAFGGKERTSLFRIYLRKSFGGIQK